MATKSPRPGYMLVPCTGEAHSNPHIDHCMVCAPRWGQMEVLNPAHRTRTDFVTEIMAVCKRIARILEPSRPLLDRFQDQISSEERQHRRGAPEGTKHGIQVGTAMMLFTAQYILRNRCAGGRLPQVADIFTVRLSIFQAAALYTRYQAALDAEFSEAECRAICAEDYFDLMTGNFARPTVAPATEA